MGEREGVCVCEREREGVCWCERERVGTLSGYCKKGEIKETRGVKLFLIMADFLTKLSFKQKNF